MGMKKISLACLPPGVIDIAIKECMTKYVDVKYIRDELWSSAYRYKVYNGVRIVVIHLKQHMPSHLSIASNETIITYDRQAPTCFKCNETGHQQMIVRAETGLPCLLVTSVPWNNSGESITRAHLLPPQKFRSQEN